MILLSLTPDNSRPDLPVWYSLSHHARYRRLQKVRRVWCRRHYDKPPDIAGRTIALDGAYIDDIPSFYLSLGEAVNGPNGYFGGGLDALSDCFCGSFGVLPPLTLRLSHFDDVRKALDSQAWCRFHAESFHEATAEGASTQDLTDCGYFDADSPTSVAQWTATYEAALASKPFNSDGYGSYFDALLRVFKENGSELVPE